MHRQLLIIKYIFERENIVNNDDSIDSFFDNGTSFPQLVSMALNEEIPDFIENPNDEIFIYSNNRNALRLLVASNANIRNMNPKFKTHHDKKKLISLILSNYFFTMKPKEILEKSNMILKQLNIQFKKTKDMISEYFLLSLLHVLTDGNVQIIRHCDKKNFDSIMTESFSKAKIPLVINKKAIDKKKEIVFIQIQIIFHIFSDKIDLIIGNRTLENKINKINKSFYPYDDIENEALLKTIQTISKENVTFKQTLENNFIPKFVMSSFNLSTIPGVDITVSSSKNILATIEYLKFVEDFKILVFDFDDQNSKEYSTKLFFRNFLNLFFIKSSRQNLIERCTTLIFRNKNIIPEDLIKKISTYDTFLNLLQFCIDGSSMKLNLEKLEINDDFSARFFKKVNIPMVINQKNLDIISYENDLPDSIFYQLQLIFDKIDSELSSLRVVEFLLNANKKITKINVLSSDIIKSSIMAKTSMQNLHPTQKNELCNKINIVNENQNDDNNEIKKNKESEKSENRNNQNIYDFDDDNDNDEEITESSMNDKNNEEEDDDDADFYDLWDKYIDQYQYSDGYLHGEDELFHKEVNYRILIKDLMENAEDDDKRKRKKLKKLKKSSKSKSGKKKNKLYKLFYYDEKSDKWIFDSKLFNQFSSDFKLNESSGRFILICFIVTKECDSTGIISHFIEGNNPDLEDNDQFYVYPLIGKNLSTLNSDFDFQNQQDKKLIFLNLHVPPSKENFPHIVSVIIRIYVFLSMICDLVIVSTNDDSMLIGQEMVVNVVNYISHSILYNRDEMKNEKQYTEYKKNFSQPKLENEFTINGKKLIVKDLKMVYFFNKANLYCSNYYYESKEGLSEFVKLFQCPQKAIFSLIDISNYQSFKYFISLINQVGSSLYSEIQNKFNCIDVSDICNQFLNLVYEIVEDSNHFSMNIVIDILFKKYMKEKKDKKEVFKQIEKDFDLHIPVYCKSIKELMMPSFNEKRAELLSDNKKKRETSKNTIKNPILNGIEEIKEIFNIDKEKSIEEQKISEKIDEIIAINESQIENIMKRKIFWTVEEIDSIIVNYNYVLQENFFNEIQEISRKSKVDFIELYQQNLQILFSKITSQQFKIKNKFELYLEEIKINETVREKNIQDEVKTKSNYMLKETENVRDLTVTIDINDNLKSYIEQDF